MHAVYAFEFYTFLFRMSGTSALKIGQRVQSEPMASSALRGGGEWTRRFRSTLKWRFLVLIKVPSFRKSWLVSLAYLANACAEYCLAQQQRRFKSSDVQDNIVEIRLSLACWTFGYLRPGLGMPWTAGLNLGAPLVYVHLPTESGRSFVGH